jgi:hypothetical protein
MHKTEASNTKKKANTRVQARWRRFAFEKGGKCVGISFIYAMFKHKYKAALLLANLHSAISFHAHSLWQVQQREPVPRRQC